MTHETERLSLPEGASCGPESLQDRVHKALEHAIHYLPSQGPIAIFVHHNTLHAFERYPFEKAVLEGLRKYRSQPYLPEERYREEYAAGRITDSDLDEILHQEWLSSFSPEQREQLSQKGWLAPETTSERETDSDLTCLESELVMLGTDRFHLHRVMLGHVIRNGPDHELQWFMAETDALNEFRADTPPSSIRSIVNSVRNWWGQRSSSLGGASSAAGPIDLEMIQRDVSRKSPSKWTDKEWSKFSLRWLYGVCQHGAAMVGEVTTDEIQVHRHRDIVYATHNYDCDSRVHELLIRFLGSITDQGFAQWGMPGREEGIFKTFSRLYGFHSPWVEPWQRELAKLIQDDSKADRDAMDSILNSLHQLGVEETEIEEFIESTLLVLPGWTGMIWQLESNAEWTPQPAAHGSLLELLAVRLILDRASLLESLQSILTEHQLKTLEHHYLSMETLASALQFHEKRHVRQTVAQRAFILFQLAQLLGWPPGDLMELGVESWQKLMDEISSFGSLERRRLFHLAYERHYRVQVLDALASRGVPARMPIESISFQIITCIDDREESFRRNLEEIEPSVETFGAAGFFSVPMYFRSATDAHYIPLCPVVVKPQHFVDEIGQLSQQELQRRQAEARRVLGHASRRIHLGSRSLAVGTVTSLLGSIASLPMVTRVLAPRLTSRIRDYVARVVRPSQATTLCIERIDRSERKDIASGSGDAKPSPDNGLNQGFTHAEMANMVDRLLGDIGMTQYSRLVFVLGHGSSSLNNPHESAYNCGACGGGRGGPNARAFASMANDLRVRRILAERGRIIPDHCVFVGGYHNTCNDAVEFFDIDRLPPSHQMGFLEAKGKLDDARKLNARERIRRFQSAPLNLNPEEALRHVETRAEDLAQARPEYNHATNAVCMVGRRSRTRGLFMDRRSFLTSYDPTTDGPDTPILNRILQAVIPVCSGISLEYYFSTVDNIGYGCGSKLPHNITSLLGVMEGAASDLRTGLSQQMVEIHEPMRILFVIENTAEAFLAIMARNPNIDLLVRNRWVQVAVLSPTSNELLVFEGDRFVPYQPLATSLTSVSNSYECFKNRRGHLPFAAIVGS